jgi:cell division protein FtsQ
MARATQRQQTSRKASRTKAKKKLAQRARRWGFSIGAGIGVLLLAGGSWQIYSLDLITRAGRAVDASVSKGMASAGFRLNQIEVKGRHKTDATRIKEAIGIAQGDSIFTSSLDDIRTNLEAIDTVRRATVERRLPDRLFIEIEERTPVAVWQNQQTLKVVDADGVVLTKEPPAEHRHLMVVVGEDAPRHLPELFRLLTAQASLAPEVTSAVRVGGRRWDLRLKNGIKVMLPEDEPADALRKLAAWKEEKKILEKAITAIDFRLKERVFIRLTPEEGQKPATAGKAQEV